LEFQACGTPVVTGAYYALLDTVRHRETGLLGRTVGDLVDNICMLLENPELARRMGDNGRAFVKERYDFTAIAGQWMDLFDRLSEGKRPARMPHKRNILRHFKWFVYINQIPQATIGRLLWWPSALEIRVFANTVLLKIMRRKS
jgi:hypothetical protein